MNLYCRIGKVKFDIPKLLHNLVIVDFDQRRRYHWNLSGQLIAADFSSDGLAATCSAIAVNSLGTLLHLQAALTTQ